VIPDLERKASSSTAAPAEAVPPLRIGILVDSLEAPRWVHRMVQEIQASSAARVALVATIPPSHGRAAAAGAGTPGGWRYLFYRLFSRWDDMQHARPDDPFQTASLRDLLQGSETLRLDSPGPGAGGGIGEEARSEILKRGLDLLLHLAEGVPDSRLGGAARLGVWFLRHGDGDVYPGAPAGFWEVMESTPVTESSLQEIRNEGGGPRTLYRSFASTDWLSVRRSRNNYYWKSSAFVLRKLLELRREGAAAPAAAEDSEVRSEAGASARQGPPGNLTMARLAASLTARYTRKVVRQALHREEWFLAASRRPGLPRGEDLEYLHPPRDRYWADPFPVEREGRLHVFLEEVPYATQRGFISVMTAKEGGGWTAPEKILERDCHLSYPFLFQWKGDWFLIPETAEGSTVELYRCRSFPGDWELEQVLFSGERMYDVTLKEIAGRWWMFASKGVEGALEWDELHLYHAGSPLGPWEPHPRNPVKSDVRSARPAGALFEWRGALCRPAQDCSRRYGYAVSINRILKIDREEYREIEVDKLLPRWDRTILGTHTLNRAGGVTMIDCLRMRPRFP
jgi:hypothetical protein